ncbi:hypothetical protein GCM10027161_22670 [Microbispora hainanensis]
MFGERAAQLGVDELRQPRQPSEDRHRGNVQVRAGVGPLLQDVVHMIRHTAQGTARGTREIERK